jgi:hypothetical protein
MPDGRAHLGLALAALLICAPTIAARGQGTVFDQLSKKRTSLEIKPTGGDQAPARPSASAAPKKKSSVPKQTSPSTPVKTSSKKAAAPNPKTPAPVRQARHQEDLADSPYLSPPIEELSVEPKPPIELPEEEYFGSPNTCRSKHHAKGKLCRFVESISEPMQGQSWLSRPLSIGFEAGGIWGGELLDDQVDSSSGKLVMLTLGWDHTNWHGYEVRFGYSVIDTFNILPPHDPRNTKLGLFDVSALLYPFQDARFRPFFRFGLGLQTYKFITNYGNEVDNIIAAGNIGVGMKFLFDRHVAFRMEFIDNIGFGDGLDMGMLHDTQLTFGAEFRFGGMHKSYWPWHSGRSIW